MKQHLDSTKAKATPVSRRNFIALAAAGSAALPAVALAEASGKTSRLPQSAEASEDACLKVRRLAKELGEALVEHENGNWFAKVYPKNEARGRSVFYGDIQAEHEARYHIEPELAGLIEAHKHAHTACRVAHNLADEVLLGREANVAEKRRCYRASRAEDKALADILAYVPWNDVSRYVKATYMAPFTAHGQLSDKQIRALLISMCGRCA